MIKIKGVHIFKLIDNDQTMVLVQKQAASSEDWELHLEFLT